MLVNRGTRMISFNRFSVLLLASFFGCQVQQVWRVWWERNCTGCLSRTESTTSCPRWRTNADTAVHLLIYPTCVPRWRTFLAVRIFVLLLREISRFQEPTQQLLAHVGSLFPARRLGTLFPLKLRMINYLLVPSKIYWKLIIFLNLGNCLI